MSSSDPRPASGPTVPAVLTWGTWIAVVLIDAHAGLGYAATLSAAVAAISAIVWKRRGGATGVMAHAVSMPILMIIQIGLGSAGIKWVHVVLGILILLGLIGLPMSLRSAARKSA